MLACIPCPEFEEDIASLAHKYPSIANDINNQTRLLQGEDVYGQRSYAFDRLDRIYYLQVSIQAFEGGDQKNRCTLIYEIARPICHLWAVVDNDLPFDEADIVERVNNRRAEPSED